MCIYIYIYIYIYNITPKFPKQRENQTIFFSLVTRKSVLNPRGIFRVSQDKENCIIGKNGP